MKMVTCFDDLSIDLVLEIFDYLAFTELFQAFYGLQQRIDNAIRSYPACMDLSKAINCNAFHHDSFMCRSLKVSSDDLEQFRMINSRMNFAILRAVTFEAITLNTLLYFVELLPMHQLESIKITKINSSNDSANMYQQIWSIIVATSRNHLRYLHVPHQISRWDPTQLSFDLPILKYVTLEYISTDRILTFMRHTPNLRRLKTHLYGLDWTENLYTYDNVLHKLNHLTLNVQYLVSFEQLNHLFSMCPHLTHLILELKAPETNKTIVESTAWQTLIEQYLPALAYLRLRLSMFLTYLYERRDFQSPFDRAEYWLQRRPSFQVTVTTELYP
jgi:hypothetical protein